VTALALLAALARFGLPSSACSSWASQIRPLERSGVGSAASRRRRAHLEVARVLRRRRAEGVRVAGRDRRRPGSAVWLAVIAATSGAIAEVVSSRRFDDNFAIPVSVAAVVASVLVVFVER
jgi:hypothetical protein